MTKAKTKTKVPETQPEPSQESKEFHSTRETLATLIKLDKASADVARITIADQVTKDDYATDINPRECIALTLLFGIQTKIKSPFIDTFLVKYIALRKSVGRKDRKEFIEMFKSIGEEQKRLDDRVKDLLGVRT